MNPVNKTETAVVEAKESPETFIKTLDDEDIQDSQEIPPPDIPWKYKWVALACIVILPMGEKWSSAALGPLKSTLREELGINNTQFGIISSADSFINSILPIVGGMVLDWFGPNPVTIFCTFIVFIGTVVGAVGVQLSIWRILAAGNIVTGLGVAILDSATHKMFYHWFGARDFAFIFGLESAVSNAIGLAGGMSAIPIRDGTGWYGWTFWIPAFFCFLSLLVNLFYVFFERRIVPKDYRLASGRTSANKKSSSNSDFRWNVLFTLPWQFLMLPATQIIQNGGAGGIDVSMADLIAMKGYTDAVAGYLSTGRKIIRIVLSPFIGWAIDRYGHRFHYVAFAPILFIISCALLGFTNVHPMVALVFSSLADTINALPLQICFPLLVRDQNRLGTAYGVWRAFNNANSTITDVVYGLLQDGTKNMGYSKVLLMAIGIKSWGFVLGLIYIIIDFKYIGKSLTLTRKRREAREADIIDPNSDPLTRRTPVKWVTIVTLCLLVAVVATAWTLFIRYLI
ncbi:hypothetical protein G7Z17_g4684 [Cylindrodendrum hubeiense]|uniref:Lysosomal dipeptide transporter MFSD1 n=1 Tax=Cylindrodendrum hubeiense TaxID=595255 RepID=A0A9P5LCF0_9HYPO|nr:hypothetical protein G7Z17_g4684 [Cylindrodendrum hubeiense]